MNEFVTCCIVFLVAVSSVLTVPVAATAHDGIRETNAPIGIPVCTGDVHLGDRDAVQVLEDNDGRKHEFAVRHREQTIV
jgi:hypothetical protein